MPFQLAPPQIGVVHAYGYNRTAFEFTSTPHDQAPNVLLFVAGLTNGILDVPYLPQLAEKIAKLNTKDGKWVLFQIIITSSYNGWATSSLKNDTRDIAKFISYLRSLPGGSRKKVVLMGHSTGCQDTIEYISKTQYKPNFAALSKIDAGILQAPISDLEALRLNSGLSEDSFEELLNVVQEEYLDKGKSSHILPDNYTKIVFNTPISAYRFYSLASKRGDDDYFSSYLTRQDFKESFGKVNVPLLTLYGSKDQFVPDFVDKEKLIEEWKQATDPEYWSPLSKILKGATHDVGEGSDEDAVEDLLDTVYKFIESL